MNVETLNMRNVGPERVGYAQSRENRITFFWRICFARGHEATEPTHLVLLVEREGGGEGGILEGIHWALV